MNATLEHIWHEFAEKLGQFIRARVNDPATAADILQDVFVKIQARLDQLKDPAKLQGWIYLIARNAIIDHYRTRTPSHNLFCRGPHLIQAGYLTAHEHLRLRQVWRDYSSQRKHSMAHTLFGLTLQ